MMNAVRKDLETRFEKEMKEGRMILQGAYTGNPEEAEEFRQEVLEVFPEFTECRMDPLSLSVACHIGYGALALTCTKVL